MKKRLIELLCHKSFKYSDSAEFKLASGAMSRFYVNCKPVTMSPEGMYLIGNLMLQAIGEREVAGVGGLTFGADPIAVATSYASYLAKHPIKAFSIRKSQKDHGMIKWVEGDMGKGERVVIVEDVVTTGGSTIKAVERAREQGLDVVQVVTLVDRQEGGMEAIRDHVDGVSAIVLRDELMDSLNR